MCGERIAIFPKYQWNLPHIVVRGPSTTLFEVIIPLVLSHLNIKEVYSFIPYIMLFNVYCLLKNVWHVISLNIPPLSYIIVSFHFLFHFESLSRLQNPSADAFWHGCFPNHTQHHAKKFMLLIIKPQTLAKY